MRARRTTIVTIAFLVIAYAIASPLEAKTPAKSIAAPSIVTKALAQELLTKRVGNWDVVMTLRPTATAAPIVVSGLVAERSVVGPYLQEIMRPAPGSQVPDFRRIDYLTYNPLQARWQYLSMDTRATVGIMFAQGAGAAESAGPLTVYFADSPAPTELGAEVGGRFLRARHVLTRESDDHELTRQYWTVDGGPEWLGVQYEYKRRSRTQ